MSAVLKPAFDWRNPNYAVVTQQRLERLQRLRASPETLSAFAQHYKVHPESFISDWGMTVDPRNIARGLPATIPFVLFPSQIEWVRFAMERWRRGENGLTEKSRDMGLSWLAMSLSATLCIFHRGLTIGIGSRKEQLIDNQGDPSSLFYKLRVFLGGLPAEFRPAYLPAHMRVVFPSTQCSVVGEAGDNIGRGARTSIYFVDESCYLENPEAIEASLSSTTNCRIDISSVHGLNNPFAQKRFSGRVPVYTMHWRSDPRKDDAWYAKQCETLDPVIVGQEIDISYQSSVEGQLIPSSWIQAAIGAHLKLGIEPTGGRYGGLDVADEGRDLCAFAARHGVVLNYLRSWTGKNSDIYQSVVRAFSICDEIGLEGFHYDADGLGAGVRGDATRINEERVLANRPHIQDTPFRGSAAVWQPDSQMVAKRLNRDFFANLKAQTWWALRMRFQETYRAVVEKLPVGVDDIISIPADLPERLQLEMELSQPTYKLNSVGKIVIDKAPDGMRSPNLADAVMICFNPMTRIYELWKKLGT